MKPFKAWTLVQKHKEDSIYTDYFDQTYTHTGVSFGLIFKTKNDANAYKIGHGLLDVKIVRIDIAGVDHG